MNTMSLAVLVIASSLAMLFTSPASKTIEPITPIPHETDETDDVLWDDQAVNWLLEAQSPNGGWGAGSHSYQNITDPHAVQTDPATTALYLPWACSNALLAMAD